MKPFSPFIALLLAPSAIHAQPAPAAQAKDPVIQFWRLEDGRHLRFRDDRSITMWTPGRQGSIEGKWVSDPFAEGIRRYQVDWKNGRVWTVEMSNDGTMLRSTSPEGEKTTSQRLDELTVYMMCNDEGGVDVNGVREFGTPVRGGTKRLLVRSGDVITLTLAKRKGSIAFAVEMFRGNASVISAKDFSYSTAPNPDWKTSKKMDGFTAVTTVKMREMSLGNITAPLAATVKGTDEKFNRLFFKYVVP